MVNDSSRLFGSNVTYPSSPRIFLALLNLNLQGHRQLERWDAPGLSGRVSKEDSVTV